MKKRQTFTPSIQSCQKHGFHYYFRNPNQRDGIYAPDLGPPIAFGELAGRCWKALRRTNSKLENRSIRRGALQTLTAAGATDQELMLFSGHTTVQMLNRYLLWGSVGSHKKTVMTKHAEALQPTPIGEQQ